jgi:hypothetical protein
MLVNRSGWNDQNALLFNLMLGKKRFIRKLRRKMKLGRRNPRKRRKSWKMRKNKGRKSLYLCKFYSIYQKLSKKNIIYACNINYFNWNGKSVL